MNTAMHMLASVIVFSTLLGGADEPNPRGASDEVYVIGKELIQLLEKDPEAVILVGESARKYLESVRARDRSAAAAVAAQQCVIQVDIDNDLARLQIDLTVRSDRSGRNPVPLGLGEGHLVNAVMDGGTPFLTHENDKWHAWVDGPGVHTISVTLQVVLSGSKHLPALVCSIPEAPVTSLILRSTRPLVEPKLNPAAPLTMRPAQESRAVFEAALGPRGKLDLRWRWGDEPEQTTAPLLRAASEVTATVEAGVVQLRTELRLQVLRGALQTCELRIAADERILDLQKADRSVIGWQASLDGAEQRVFIHFAEPLTRNADLVIDSELPISGESRPLRGMTVVAAHSHRSLIVLRTAAELDVAVSEVTHARRTATLPATLRSPRNELALAGYAQPVQAKLSILPRRTGTSVRSAVLLACDGETTRVVTRWQFAVHAGKVSHVDFHLPAPFQTAHFLFSDTVQTIREEVTPEGRFARVFLKGTPDEFELRLRAAVPQVFARNLAKLDLPFPHTARSELSRLFVVGSDNISIEPTPELVSSSEPVDALLARELADPQQAVQAFQSRAMLDRVAFRLIPRVPAIRSVVRSQITLDADFAQVQQSFEITASGPAVRQLRFTVPEAVRGAVSVASGPWRCDETSSDQVLTLRLDTDTTDTPRVQLNYRVPAPLVAPRVDTTLVVPLIQNLDGPCDFNEARVFAPGDMLLQVPDDRWQRVAAIAQPGAASDKPRLALRHMDAADSLPLTVSYGNPLLRRAVWIDRALIETTIGARGEWHTRARYRVAELPDAALAIQLPPGARITRVRWGEQAVRARPDAQPNRIHIEALSLDALPAILEVEMSSPSEPSSSVWSMQTWEAPAILGDTAWGQVRWLVTLPDHLAIVRGPLRYADDNHVRWLAAPLRLTPRENAVDLERWLGTRPSGSPTAQGGNPLLYGRILSLEPMSMECIDRPILILIASGAVMVMGLVIIVSPRHVRIGLMGVAALACAALTIWEPTAMVSFARGAGIGVLLVAIAGSTHLWLLRRATPRRTVFPEAAMLARIQHSTVIRSPEFDLADRPVSGAHEAYESPAVAPGSTSSRRSAVSK